MVGAVGAGVVVVVLYYVVPLIVDSLIVNS